MKQKYITIIVAILILWNFATFNCRQFFDIINSYCNNSSDGYAKVEEYTLVLDDLKKYKKINYKTNKNNPMFYEMHLQKDIKPTFIKSDLESEYTFIDWTAPLPPVELSNYEIIKDFKNGMYIVKQRSKAL